MTRIVRFLILSAFSLVLLSLSVCAQNATNSTPLNFSSTICDAQCSNSTMDWTTTFVCDSGLPGVMYSCCNNKTLCELRFNQSCYNVVYLVPQVIPSVIINNSNTNTPANNNNVNPASTSSSGYNEVTDTARRVMRLFVNGDIAGEPIYISANNIFGPMKGVKVVFYKDGSAVKTVETDGETEVVLDQPGQYTIDASRVGYLNARARMYLYEKQAPVVERQVEHIVEEEPVPEPVEQPAVYNPITSMTTISSPKSSVAWPKFALLLVGLTGIMVFIYRKMQGKAPKEPEKPNFGF